MRIPPLQVTEEALALLAEIQAESATHGKNASAGRIRVTGGLQAGGRSSMQGGWLIFRMVSVVEAYVEGVSQTLLSEQAVGQNELFRLLLLEAQASMSDTWDTRKDAFSKYHKIPLGNCARWSEIDAAIVIRNAVAHGLGRLTARQRNSATINKLATIGIQVIDDRPIITSPVMTRCYQACRSFIQDLDKKAAKAYFEHRKTRQEAS